MKKHLLYIGHEYHLKTRSVGFLFDIFRKDYELTCLCVDPHKGSDEVDISSVSGQHFDLLVCLQVMPSIDRIRRSVTFDHAAFFPMADYYFGACPVSHPIWREYAGFHIISFSKRVYDEVRLSGFDARYVQYFPEPPEDPPPGNPTGVFFWQRVTDINPWLLQRLLKDFPIDELHMHYAIDPGMQKVGVPEDLASRCRITESSWFETREEMTKRMVDMALYVAPRDIEGIGMSFLEAMSYGRCVLAENSTTMNEYICHGKTGFLYRRGEKSASIPLRSPDQVRRIQKNVRAYMWRGWTKWRVLREQIPVWCVSPLSCDPEKVAKGELSTWLRFMRSFKGANVAWAHEHTIRLCGIPLISCKRDAHRTACRWEILRFPVYESREEAFQ